MKPAWGETLKILLLHPGSVLRMHVYKIRGYACMCHRKQYLELVLQRGMYELC